MFWEIVPLSKKRCARPSVKAAPHNSAYRYGERGAPDAKQKAQIILFVLSSIFATQMVCIAHRSGAQGVSRELCGVALSPRRQSDGLPMYHDRQSFTDQLHLWTTGRAKPPQGCRRSDRRTDFAAASANKTPFL